MCAMRREARAVDAARNHLVAKGSADDGTVVGAARAHLADIATHEDAARLVVNDLRHLRLKHHHGQTALRAVVLVRGHREGIVDMRKRSESSLLLRRLGRLLRCGGLLLEFLVESRLLGEGVVPLRHKHVGGLRLLPGHLQLVEEQRELVTRDAFAVASGTLLGLGEVELELLDLQLELLDDLQHRQLVALIHELADHLLGRSRKRGRLRRRVRCALARLRLALLCRARVRHRGARKLATFAIGARSIERGSIYFVDGSALSVRPPLSSVRVAPIACGRDPCAGRRPRAAWPAHARRPPRNHRQQRLAQGRRTVRARDACREL